MSQSFLSYMYHCQFLPQTSVPRLLRTFVVVVLALTFLFASAAAAGLDEVLGAVPFFPSSFHPDLNGQQQQQPSTYDVLRSFSIAAVSQTLAHAAHAAAIPSLFPASSNDKTTVTSVDELVKFLSHTGPLLSAQLRQGMADEVRLHADAGPPYFGFIPQFIGRSTAALQKPLKAFMPSCNTSLIVTVRHVDMKAGQVAISLEWTRSSSSSSSSCVDELLLTVGPRSASYSISNGSAVPQIANITVHGCDFTAAAGEWDVMEKGVRVFRMRQADATGRFLEVLDTALLFLPMLTGVVDDTSALMNVDFLSNFSRMEPYAVPRAFKAVVDLDESSINDGDLFAKMELDGLGPVEGFAQGTTSGHTAFAIRNQSSASSGELLVCEAVATGITCTKYREWVAGLQRSGAAAVLVPLAPSFSLAFNSSKAWAHVESMLGNSYGFYNFFFGWVDTEEDNYPCFPWAFNRCLSYDIVEYFFLFLDDIVPEVSNLLFGQALNHRAQTGNLHMKIMETLYEAATGPLRIPSRKLMTIPESDAWLYNSTKQGVPGRVMLPSQVCSSFACSTLRAAGVFNAPINSNITCTEIDVWDIFSLQIFDSGKFGEGRPEPCKQADPENNLCQLSGNWTFNLLQDVNTRPLRPQMSLHCASRNPSPYNHTGC